MGIMGMLVDLAYLAGVTAASPVLVPRMLLRGRHRTDWSARLGHVRVTPAGQRPRILLHAVSVGEVNAIGELVDRLLQSPESPEVVIATTTDTGFSRACDIHDGRCQVVRYPLDLSRSVNRFLDRVRPDVAAMVELELWPNFSRACERRGIPLAVVNGRLSARSHRGYSRFKPFIRPMFRRLDCAAVQTQAYAKRFESLGTRPGSIVLTGTMKWDTARIEDDVAGARELAEELGIDLERPLVVAGSTAPDEHRLLMDAVPRGVQLLCAPRRPEWFDDAAGVMAGCARRSRGDRGSDTDRFLLDTIGELRRAYALADVVVIGRSFGDLHGSDMMEPAALGKPVLVGPATGDFQETVDRLVEGGGIVITDRSRLAEDIGVLLDDPDRRARMVTGARSVIRREQGATEKTAALLLSMLDKSDATGGKAAADA
jgi:3-deoxy-D-manno-octulosonic-acid transferase